MTAFTCSICGSPDYITVAPGTAADASHYSPNVMTDTVAMFPGAPVPTRAWCLEHYSDGLVRVPGRPDRTDADIELPEDESGVPGQIDLFARDAVVARVARAKLAIVAEIAAAKAGLPLVIAALLLGTAHAEPPLGADPALAPWYRSLQSPTGVMCCSIADCRPVVTRERDGRTEAFIDRASFRDGPDEWLAVPPEVVLHGHDNPAGEPVACFYGGAIRCFVEGSGT